MRGSVVLWFCGSVVLWFCGSVVLWFCGSTLWFLFGTHNEINLNKNIKYQYTIIKSTGTPATKILHR